MAWLPCFTVTVGRAARSLPRAQAGRSFPTWGSFIMFKSVIHYFLEIVSTGWRGPSNVILSRKSGSLLPSGCSATRGSLFRNLEGVRLTHHRGVGELGLGDFCARKRSC